MRKLSPAIAMTTAMVFAALRKVAAQTPTATFSMSVPRGPTTAEIGDGVPADVTIYEFFVSTNADILSINQVSSFPRRVRIRG